MFKVEPRAILSKFSWLLFKLDKSCMLDIVTVGFDHEILLLYCTSILVDAVLKTLPLHTSQALMNKLSLRVHTLHFNMRIHTLHFNMRVHNLHFNTLVTC